MKKVFYFSLLAFLAMSCSKNEVNITVENPSDFDRSESVVEIPLNTLENKLSITKNEMYVVLNEVGDTLPSQQTYDDKLIFQSGLKANEVSKFTIAVGLQKEFETKVHGQVQPRRMSDFHWENDKVGFRYYNAELKAHDGPSNGLDLWYKRTNKIVVAEWYEKELAQIASYHQDHGEGCDPYGVGRTLGAGSIAPYIDGKLILNENYETSEVLENGPLRLTFKLTYPDMDINGETVSESKLISLDAGSQITKVIQAFGNKEDMNVAVGIVKRASDQDAILHQSGDDYFIYQEPVMDPFGQIFLGVIIPQGIDSVFVDSYKYTNPINNREYSLANTLGTTVARPNAALTYYTGFGWNKFGFATVAEFETYVKHFSQELETPFIVKF